MLYLQAEHQPLSLAWVCPHPGTPPAHMDTSVGRLQEIAYFSPLFLSGLMGFPGGSEGGKKKKIRLQCRRPRFDPSVGKIPWRREWVPAPVFLPGELHGQKSLVGYSPWGQEESDTTEQWEAFTFAFRLDG